jgi:hypothetical protein
MREQLVSDDPVGQLVPFARRSPVNANAPFTVLRETSCGSGDIQDYAQENDYLVFALLKIHHHLCGFINRCHQGRDRKNPHPW